MFTRNVLSLGILVATWAVACSSSTQQIGTVPSNPAQAKKYCSGVSANADVLSRPGLIEAVYEDHEQEQWGHNTVAHLKGAKVMVRPEPGVTRPMLGRALQCRIAERSSALAISDSDALPGHAQVQVSETDTGYMIVISSQNEDEAREIVRQANNLLARSVARSHDNAETPQVSAR
jgi:uncharacterized protein YdbL (DUF1318 family)